MLRQISRAKAWHYHLTMAWQIITNWMRQKGTLDMTAPSAEAIMALTSDGGGQRGACAHARAGDDVATVRLCACPRLIRDTDWANRADAIVNDC